MAKNRSAPTIPSAKHGKSELGETFRREADGGAERERHIQHKVDSLDQRKPAGEPHKRAMQAGQREYPAKFPEQHIEKPGNEGALDLPPMFEAPEYKGSGKLRDKVALITGGDSGIGRAIAVLYAREGADVAICYLPEEQSDAEETRDEVEAAGRKCVTIAGDLREAEFCGRAVQQTVRELGRLDVLVNNAAFQQHQSSIEAI